MDPTLQPPSDRHSAHPPPASRARDAQASPPEAPAGPRLAAPPPAKTRAAQGAGLAGSAALHALLALLIAFEASAPPAPEAQEPVEFEVVQKPPPPPPPPPEPAPEEKKPEPPKVVKPKPTPKPLEQAAPPPPKDAPPPPPELTEELPPPPNDAAPADAPPQAPLMIGISMSSTTTAGSFAAPVGNTLYGSAPTVAPKPEEVKPYASPTGRYVPRYKVTKLPELSREVKAKYPEEARKLGIEGQVILELTIDATGKVAEARLVKRAGHGFDEAALEAVRRFVFKPGTEGGEPIVTEITYTYTFQLD